jgi:hypothetical protein
MSFEFFPQDGIKKEQRKSEVKKKELNNTEKYHNPLGLQTFEAPKICNPSAHEGRNVSHTYLPPLPARNRPGTHFC